MSGSAGNPACVVTGNLPAEVTSFVGRRKEIADVKQVLSQSRLVTLTGPGGVGKTRLALRVAADLRRAFPDGVWLVELANLKDPELLVETVVACLGIQDYSAQGLTATLQDFLRPKHLLLLLDNCEHLSNPTAVLINALLPAAANLHILATSRQSLGVAGERVLPVPPLSVPTQSLPLGQMLTQSEAATLFATRASAVLPQFALTPDNGPAVLEICRRLDGIPLALELAAVRLRALSVDQILQRLDDRFRLLSVGRRTAVSRQQTLLTLIDWSYDHCTEQERELWMRATVFAGGFDLTAVEEVCAGHGIPAEETVDLVDALVDKSILTAVDGQNGTMRYRMLETIRQYGEDKLASSAMQPIMRRRHKDYFQRFTDTAKQHSFSPDQISWYVRLRQEHANLRGALEFCLTVPGEAQSGLTIAINIWSYMMLRYLSEARIWYGRMLAQAPEATHTRATALWSNAWVASLQGDYAAASASLTECRAVAESLNDHSNVAYANMVAGWVALCEGDVALATALLEKAGARQLALNDPAGIAIAKNLLGVAISLSGDADRATALCKESLAVCDAHGDHWVRSWTLFQFAFVSWRQDDRRRVATLAREGLREKYDLDDLHGIGLCLEPLAWVAAADNRHEHAARLLGAARGTRQAMGASLPRYLQPDHDQCIAETRDSLGEKAFAEAFEQGRASTIEKVIAEATEKKDERSPAPPSAERVESTGLTRREEEVAVLVAEGLTNKEIASRLVISKRTAEGHIEHIMTKLGFTSRSQIAAWITSKNS